MKICSQCGQVNDDDARFCVRDGWALPDSVDETKKKSNNQVCKECGFENSPEVKFCGGCGKPLGKETKEKQKDDKSVLAFVKLFTLIFGIFIALSIAVNIHDMDFSELFDDASELFEDKKDCYFKVHMHHSSEIDKDGETINLSIDTNFENLDMNKLHFKVENVSWWNISYGDYYLPKATSSVAKYAKKPIVNMELVDDKKIKMTIDRNSGYRRRFLVEVTASGSIDYSSFFIEQEGYKEWNNRH